MKPPRFVCQVWNRYHGSWQTVKQPITGDHDALAWWSQDPDKRRVLDDGAIIHQPRD